MYFVSFYWWRFCVDFILISKSILHKYVLGKQDFILLLPFWFCFLPILLRINTQRMKPPISVMECVSRLKSHFVKGKNIDPSKDKGCEDRISSRGRFLLEITNYYEITKEIGILPRFENSDFKILFSHLNLLNNF